MLDCHEVCIGNDTFGNGALTTVHWQQRLGGSRSGGKCWYACACACARAWGGKNSRRKVERPCHSRSSVCCVADSSHHTVHFVDGIAEVSGLEAAELVRDHHRIKVDALLQVGVVVVGGAVGGRWLRGLVR